MVPEDRPARRPASSPRPGRPRWTGLRTGLASLGLLASCSTYLAVPDQQELADRLAFLSGTVSTSEELDGARIVCLLAEDPSGELRLIDYYCLEEDGEWVFGVTAGTYWLAAVVDVDRDGRYDAEPALEPDLEHPLHVEAGARLADLNLRIDVDSRLELPAFALDDVILRSAEEQGLYSLLRLVVAGEVTTLDHPRFAQDVAQAGLWQHVDFVLEHRAGIYFLQEYDPAKIPVLFVHGISATPRELGGLIDALDPELYQAWVYYYPSGAGLPTVARLLSQLFERLRLQLDFPRAVVVAHSMGGLVSREFLLDEYRSNHRKTVNTLVTIASPLNGVASAGLSLRFSPIVVDSWRDVAPGSAFLEGLYYEDPETRTTRRRLPPHVAYHLIFAFQEDSGDGVATISSQLRKEAQEEAATVRGFEDTHTGVLTSPEVARYLRRILAVRAGRP